MVKKFKYIKILLLLFTVYFCYYSYLKWWGYPVTKYSPKLILDDNFNGSKNVNKKILIWTNHYWVPPKERIKSLNNIQHCSKKCLYVDDRNDLSNVNAILFHSNADNLDLNNLPPARHPSQSYIFFTQESPPKAARKNFHQIWRHFPKNFFNLTMTYRSDSDIIAAYDKFISINSETSKNEIYSLKDVESAVEKKYKSGLVFVGNCYSESGRERIVRKLANLLDIDQFGYCSGRRCDKECENRIIGNYYFFLAFENNICADYITEKFWRIKKLIVPIVLQRSIITSQIAPNNSFIAVDDFGTIEELAKYLKYLMANKTAYMKYFEWTKVYQKKELSWDDGYCRLCERISDNGSLSYQSYYDINQWFDSAGTCKIVFMNGFFELLILWKKTSFVIFVGILGVIFVMFKILKCYCKNQ